MPRETKTIQTPIAKLDIVINSYITGRERRALTNVYLSGGLDFNFNAENVKGLNGDMMDKAQDLAWKTIIVSVGGHKESDVVDGKAFSIVDAILDLRDEDSQFVIKAVNEITASADFAQKKTP